MAKTTTAVSVRGDKEYTTKLYILAAKRNVRVADLVRLALDQAYGHILDNQQDFIAHNGNKIDHSEKIISNRERET